MKKFVFLGILLSTMASSAYACDMCQPKNVQLIDETASIVEQIAVMDEQFEALKSSLESKEGLKILEQHHAKHKQKLIDLAVAKISQL